MPTKELKIVLEDLRDMAYTAENPRSGVTLMMTKVEGELARRKNPNQ